MIDRSHKEAESRLYCAVCETHLQNRSNYRRHLKTPIHIERTNRKRVPLGSLPNEFDPDFYCCSCNRRYDTIDKFRLHLRRHHKMKLTPLNQPVPTLISHLIQMIKAITANHATGLLHQYLPIVITSR